MLFRKAKVDESMRSASKAGRNEEPSYDRTWYEIEQTLDIAIEEMYAQRAKFYVRRNQGQKEAKYRALMKYQRAKGIVDTLRWTIGIQGQKSPLEEGLGD